jgi:hypothetical protein
LTFVRVALKKSFFALIGAFGKEEKFTLAEIAAFGTFENFRDQIIEKQLRSKYLKNLLYMLAEKWKVECVDASEGPTFARLIEIVLRRNIHVHNRGIIDQRYLDEDKNLDGFKLGEAAPINASYLALANVACSHCIGSAARWADSV